jgi:hypothetical protein
MNFKTDALPSLKDTANSVTNPIIVFSEFMIFNIAEKKCRVAIATNANLTKHLTSALRISHKVGIRKQKINFLR